MTRLLPYTIRQALLLLLVGFVPPLLAQDTPPTLTIQQMGDQLTVDDDFSDWDDFAVLSSLDVLKTQNDSGVNLNGDGDLAADVKMTYDATNLYILVNVTDDVISTKNEAQPWQNDGIEISLLMTDSEEQRTAWSHNAQEAQPGQQKIFYNVGYDTEAVIDGSNSAEGDYSNATITTMMKGSEDARTGYMVEYVLPWAAINNDNPDFNPMTEGSRFSMNVAVNDNDDEANPNNAEFDARREHTLLLVDANMNNQGELFAYVELAGAGSSSAMMFSDDPYFGNTENYTFFVNPEGANGASVDDWTVMDVDGDAALTLTNGAVNPTHPSGNPFFNPDDTKFTNGQFSAPGAYAVAADTSFADFEMMVSMRRPSDQTSNFYDLAVLFGYEDADNFSYANFGVHPTEATATIVPVVDGEGQRTPADPRFTLQLPVFPNDAEAHEVLLRREGSQVALFIDGEPVMFTSEDAFNTEGSVGVGSWNDNGIYDDITVMALEGDYASKMSFVTAATSGTLTFDSLTNLGSELTVSTLIDALTLSEGATATVQDAAGTTLANDATLMAGSMLVVTAEAGNSKMYALGFGEAEVENDLAIERVFDPVTLNADSTALTTLEGTTVELLLDRIRAPEGATEQVVDADGNVITDLTTAVDETMEYQLVGADGATRNYPISLRAPDFFVADIAPVEVVIDAFFTEWDAIDQQFAIDGTSKNTNLADTMPTAEDISGFFKATYDTTNLYLYFNITDDNLSVSAADAFRNDGIEVALLMPTSLDGRSDYNLFFDQANQPGNQKFVYTYGADWTTTFNNSGLDPFNKSSTLFAGAVVETFEKEDGTGYEVEMQIPWSGLSQNDTEVSDEAVTGQIGDAFSINVSINDNDGGDDRQSVKYFVSPQLNRDGGDFAVFRLSNTTPTRNLVADFALDVFPNPTNGQLRIQTDKQIEQVAVYSLTGQTLLRTTNTQLDVSQLRAGAYLMQITTQDRLVKMVRFIKR